ncbi:MAG: FliH/SctL family protein [Myxococcota bacterium]
MIRATTVVVREEVEARDKLKSMIEAADREVAAIRASAEQVGYVEGRARAAATLVAAEAARRRLLAEAEAVIRTLGIRVAERLLRAELQADPGKIQAIVTDALGALPAHAQKVRIRLHPHDAKGLPREFAPLVHEDSTLAHGDCIVESDGADVEARLDVRLKKLMQALAAL